MEGDVTKMCFINRLMISLKQRAELERLAAMEYQNQANIEYLAMMSDIDLDDEEEAYIDE